MAEAGPGKIRLFNDFTGLTPLIANTTDFEPLGDFYAGGEGIEDGDAGVCRSVTAPLSGSVTMTSGNTDLDSTFIGTNLMFDVALMGTLVLEARLQLPDLATKEIFVGFTGVLATDHQMADSMAVASATALTMTTTANCGFLFSNELTATLTEWHGVYSGGTTTGASATVADVNLGTDSIPVAGEWQVLRLEIDSNGDARWFVNGDLKQSKAACVSTTTDLAAAVVFTANTTEFVIGDIDYLLVTGNRNWTV